MSTPINLNKVRKDRARVERKARADENAVAYGRSKAEKEALRKHREKQVRDLEAHKRER